MDLQTGRLRDLWRFPGLSFALLLATAVVAVDHNRGFDVVLAVASVLALAAWGLERWRRRPLDGAHGIDTEHADAPTRRERTQGSRAVELLLYLSPVLLLGIAYPLASSRLAHHHVGGVPLTTLLLASSVTVPWLTQAVCLPLYKAVAVQIEEGDSSKLRDRLCDVWPSAFLRCLPTVAVFAVPVELSARWSPSALGTYVALCALYVAFAQSLILSIVNRNRRLWALGWGSLAATLLVAPSLWYLPPLVALATQLLPLRRHLYRMARPVSIERGEVLTDLVRGLLLGSVLWADKLLLFVKDGSHFAITTVFLGLLPAILAYNYYFVHLAPRFDSSVGELRAAMEHEPYSRLAERSKAVSQYVAYSLHRTGLAAAALVLAVTTISAIATPSSLPLITTVAIASWLFMMTTLLCYKLDYIGQRALAQRYSAAHLVGCILAFALFHVGAGLYGWLIGMEAVIFMGAFYSVGVHWRSSEYNLFWRHATAW